MTIAYNEVFNVQPAPVYTAGCDWNGIDLDGGTTNSTVQYNYTHHNAGAGYLGYNGNPSGTTWGLNTYRYNISENDDWEAAEGGAFGVVPNAPPNPVYIYGNTFFNNLAERGSAIPACFYFGYAAGTWAFGSLIADNICDINNPSGGVNLYNNPYGQTGMTLLNNLYDSSASPTWVWGSPESLQQHSVAASRREGTCCNLRETHCLPIPETGELATGRQAPGRDLNHVRKPISCTWVHRRSVVALPSLTMEQWTIIRRH